MKKRKICYENRMKRKVNPQKGRKVSSSLESETDLVLKSEERAEDFNGNEFVG